jgi:hypothetical protein
MQNERIKNAAEKHRQRVEQRDLFPNARLFLVHGIEAKRRTRNRHASIRFAVR